MSIAATVRRESFELSKQTLGPMQREVLAEVSFSGKRGLTPWEHAEAHGLLVHAVRPRFTELAQAGKIVEAGTRWHERTGRNETVWILSAGPEQAELF